MNNRTLIGASLGGTASAHTALGNAQEAIGYYEQSLAISSDLRGEGASLYGLGSAYADLGKLEKLLSTMKRHYL